MSVPANAQHLAPASPPAVAEAGFFPAPIRAGLNRLNRFVESFVPEACERDPNLARRARLVAHFGVQGSVFGPAYAIFYLLIGHYWGAGIIVACSVVFAAVPVVLKRTGNLDRTGHLLVGTMAAGFSALMMVEGGMHGHSIAWIASVPLCALLVLGHRRALRWAALCMIIGASIAVATVSGLELLPAFDPKWRNLVDAAGYVGLIAFLFLLGLVFDVSRRRAHLRMRESLAQQVALNEKLAHLNNEKTEFLGIAAHDLRNPLSVIIGYADLLALDGDEKVTGMAKEIRTGGKRMLALINDLLDTHAIEEGAYASHVERCDLAALTEQCLAGHRVAAGRKRIGVQFQREGPCWALADPKAALQVLDNLVSNALKYSPLDGVVQVRLGVDGDWCEWVVQDRGEGISATDQHRLFQKHARLSARPTGGESSTGLGLSIVKRLAESMGGTVTCQSTAGAGATFILRLRAADRVPA